ncbi:MAG: ketopantoate reductase family protein [Myxococcota bacterium]
MSSPIRALIVGAGAVGQVYGLALQRAGVDVSVFVKPKYAAKARAGFLLHALNRPAGPVRLDGVGVLTTADEVRAQRWDQVWLAVSSTAIEGPWLEDILAATGDATVVCLQPGPEGRARVAPLAGSRMITGIIGFVAYQAPLPGETRFAEPGIAFWFPPGPSPFAGPAPRVQPVVDALRKGGCPAAVTPSTDAAATFGSALLQVHVGALDSVDWSWDRVRRGDHLALAARAWREAASVGAAMLGVRRPWWAGLVRPWGTRLALRILPRLVPIDLPTYLGYHFTKVGDQTRANLDVWIVEGRKRGLPVTALETLRGRMRPAAVFDPALTLRV